MTLHSFDADIDSEGVWVQALATPEAMAGRRALFLDRDGVVIHDEHYLHEPEKARLIPGAGDCIRAARRAGAAVVMVTNQAGISRGLFGWNEFAAVQEKILGDLAALEASFDAVLACPHHPKGQEPYFHPDHPARKPNPGMLTRARDLWGVDLAPSWIVGDKWDDLEAGRRAGISGGVHVLTGHGSDPGQRDKALALGGADYRALGADSIAEAVGLIPFLT